MAIDALSSLSSASSYIRNDVSATGNDLTMTDFYTLLAAQLRYQDADNPMDTAEMMSQMVQTQMIQAITKMTNNNQNSQASSMIGQTVTVYETDANGKTTGEVTSGEVSYVTLGNSSLGTEPKIYVNGKAYTLSQIAAVGKQPVEEK